MSLDDGASLELVGLSLGGDCMMVMVQERRRRACAAVACCHLRLQQRGGTRKRGHGRLCGGPSRRSFSLEGRETVEAAAATAARTAAHTALSLLSVRWPPACRFDRSEHGSRHADRRRRA